MTQFEALHEARRRWGDRGDAWVRPSEEYFVSDGHAAWEREMYGLPDNFGSGDSWEAAFADADSKERA